MVITGGTRPLAAAAVTLLGKMDVMEGGPADTFRLTLITAATTPLERLVNVMVPAYGPTSSVVSTSGSITMRMGT